MSIVESLQDIIGKYSVTGVLRERLELELRQFEIERSSLSEQLITMNAKIEEQVIMILALSTENQTLRSNLQKTDAEIKELRNTAPPMSLELGAEIVLGRLSARPSGCTVTEISNSSDNAPEPADALSWIEEFANYGFVENINEAGVAQGFRLTPAGRTYARRYFDAQR